jgi:hypothetical protein
LQSGAGADTVAACVEIDDGKCGVETTGAVVDGTCGDELYAVGNQVAANVYGAVRMTDPAIVPNVHMKGVAPTGVENSPVMAPETSGSVKVVPGAFALHPAKLIMHGPGQAVLPNVMVVSALTIELGDSKALCRASKPNRPLMKAACALRLMSQQEFRKHQWRPNALD